MRCLIVVLLGMLVIMGFCFMVYVVSDEGNPEVRAANLVRMEEQKVLEEANAKIELQTKNDKRLAKLRKSSGWDEEYGNLTYNADGSLKDPVPGDGYTASQNYWVLVMMFVGIMCVWAGVCTRHPVGMAIACIIVIVIAIKVWFVWGQ